MTRFLWVAAAVVAAPPILSASALAATATEVTVAYGDLLQQASGVILTLAAAAMAWAFRALPPSILTLIKVWQVDQLLAKAIEYGINTVVGASKDRTLTFDMGNAVLAKAVQYVVDHAPGWLIAWAGGPEMIRQKLIARMDIEPAAALR